MKSSPVSADAGTTAQAVIHFAADGLTAWERGVGLDDLLDDLPPKAPRRAIASLLFAVFRHRARTDELLDRLAPRADAELRPILVAALTQALTQHGIPGPVAVDVAVSHARQRRGRGAAGFVNAVLRRSLEAAAAQPPPNPVYLLPPVVRARWRAAFGEAAVPSLADLFQQEAPLTFRLRKSLPENEFAEVEAAPLALPAWAGQERFLSCPRPAELLHGPWLDRGDIYVQDPSTAAAPLLVAAPSGLVLDLCAAPGGKSLILAERLVDGRLVAADLSPRRQRRTAANFAAAGLRHAFAIAADARRSPIRPAAADLVLLDVPCTNTGVFRRRPDALWRFSPERLAELVLRQRELLESAAALVRPGGNLVYSTCSLEAEENRDQVDAFLRAHPEFTAEREVAIIPATIHDGGFAILLARSTS
jgi:16S rRNA (cytosine967-C5)-methyltransferase